MSPFWPIPAQTPHGKAFQAVKRAEKAGAPILAAQLPAEHAAAIAELVAEGSLVITTSEPVVRTVPSHSFDVGAPHGR